MKLTRVTELPADELEMLLIFVNMPIGIDLMDTINKFLENKTYKYSELLYLASENDNTVKIDVSKDFGDIMFDAYDVYYHLKETLTDAHKQYPKIDGLKMMFNFIPLYEKYLLSSKFDKIKTRTIQKMFLENLLIIEIANENYEYCSELKETIEKI